VVASHAIAPASDAASAPAEEHERSENGNQPETEGARQQVPWGEIQALAMRQLDRLMALEPKVLRGDDPDAIHDMRIATRRLQQMLDLMFPAPQPREVARIRKRVRRCRSVLSDVRNCDVLLQHAREALRAKKPPHAAAWEAFYRYVEKQRERNFRKATEEISRQHLAALYLRLKPWLTSAPRAGGNGQPEEGDQGTAENLNERLKNELERTWTTFHDRLEGARQSHARLGIHELRIATKRLRYLTEALHQLKQHGAATVLAGLRSMQQTLGEWHDLEVTGVMLTELAARRKFLRDQLDTAAAVLRLIRSQRAAKKSFEERTLKRALSEEKTGMIEAWVEDTLKTLAGQATA
jgi:CHAD domain-containing protein